VSHVSNIFHLHNRIDGLVQSHVAVDARGITEAMLEVKNNTLHVVHRDLFLLYRNYVKLFILTQCHMMKGSPGPAVKLLPCDHEVMGSSPGNKLLQKCSRTLPQTLHKQELHAPDCPLQCHMIL
jgi:hypothetical protein